MASVSEGGLQGPVGVCGAGSMGLGIAQVAAQAGAQVTVFDISANALEKGRDSIKSALDKRVARGKMTADEAKAILARVSWASDLDALASSMLVIEAVIERLDIKVELFQSLEKLVAQDTILATNTSSLAISTIAAKLAHPERFIGLHFFNPAPVMKLVEVIRGSSSAAAHIESAIKLMQQWGKKPVVAADVPGFIVNRVARPFYSEGWRAFEEGVGSAAAIDHAFRALGGFRMGPLELGDFIGHDINFTAADSIYRSYFGRTRFTPSLQQSRLVEAGLLGRKSGAGVYDYGADAVKQKPEFLPGQAESSDVIGSILAAPLGTLMDIDGVNMGRVYGPSALQLAAQSGRPTVLFDHGLSQVTESLIIQVSCDDAAASAQKISDRPVLRIKDRAGGLVFRTWCQLANCAADAVRDSVAAGEEVDTAMLFGVNYPMGPMQWARDIGFNYVCEALGAIQTETGDVIYAPSEQLQRWKYAS